MIEVEYGYSKSHDTAVIYYRQAMYEVPFTALVRTGTRYKVDVSYLTEENIIAMF